LDVAIRLDGGRPEFFQALSTVQAEQYRYGDALAALEQAYALAPENAMVVFQRGRVRARMKDSAQALEDLDRAEALGHPSVECDFERGQIAFHREEWTAARAAFDRVLAKQPAHTEARQARARARRRLGDIQGAERDLRVFEAIKAQEEQIERAKARLLREEEPANRAAIFANLGRSLLGQHRPEEAVAAYEAALATDPGLMLAYIGLAASAAASGDLPAAESAAREALRRDPQSAEAEALLGEIAYRRGDTDTAVHRLRKALRARPTLHSATLTLAEALLSRADPEAAAWFRRAVEQDIDDPFAHEGLARALARTDGLDEALDHAREAVARNPAVPAFHNTHAVIAFRLGRLDEARTALLAALDLAPRNENYLAGLAEVEAALQAREP
jgi:superkiller protein 3